MPHSRVTGNTRPEVKGLKASPPGAKISVAQPDASNLKTVSQGRSIEERDYSFLFVDARFGGAGGPYNGSSNRKRKDDSRRSKKNGNGGGSPGDQDPDDDDNDGDSGDDDTPSGDGHSLSSSSNTQRSQADLKLRAKCPSSTTSHYSGISQSK